MYPFRECREKVGYTQKFVALSLHVKPPSVSDWEQGNTCPTLENLEKMADLYQVSVDELLGRSAKTGTEYHATTAQEKKLVEDFRSLNQQGREYVLQSMAMAVRIYISGKSHADSVMEKQAR